MNTDAAEHFNASVLSFSDNWRLHRIFLGISTSQKKMSVLTLHLIIALMGEYASLSTPQFYKGRNDLEIPNYFLKLQLKFNKLKCFVCSIKIVSGCFTQVQSLTPKQAPALLALCWSATYIHPNRNQIVKNKSQQNQISFSSIFGANCPALKPCWACAHVAL